MYIMLLPIVLRDGCSSRRLSLTVSKLARLNVIIWLVTDLLSVGTLYFASQSFLDSRDEEGGSV